MRNFFLILVCLFFLSLPHVTMAGVPSSPPPQMLLHTTAGEILIAFDKDHAPLTTAQITKFAQDGLYDGVDIPRIDRGYLIQVSEVWNSNQPRAPQLWTKLSHLPFENPEGRHTAGAVSLASETPEGGGISSFYFMLNDRPDLDKNYTVFAHVRSGMDVLRRIEAAGLAAKPRILWAEILSPELADRVAAALDNQETTPSLTTSDKGDPLVKALALLLGGIVFTCCVAAAFARQLSRRHLLAMTLLGGVFALIALITLLKPSGPLAGGAAVLALLGLYRLMSNFENIGRDPGTFPH